MKIINSEHQKNIYESTEIAKTNKKNDISEIDRDIIETGPRLNNVLGSSKSKCSPTDQKLKSCNLIEVIALSKSDAFSEKIQQARQQQAIEAALKTVPRSGRIGEFTIALSNALNKILGGESNRFGYGSPIEGEASSHRGHPWHMFYGGLKYYEATNKIKIEENLDKYNQAHGTNYTKNEMGRLIWDLLCQLPKAKLFGLTDWAGSSDYFPALKFGKFIIHNCYGPPFNIFTTSKLQNSVFRVSDKPGPAKTS